MSICNTTRKLPLAQLNRATCIIDLSLSLSPQASCEAQEREIFALTALRDPWLIELQSLLEMSMELRHKIRASDRSWTQGKPKKTSNLQILLIFGFQPL